MKRHRAVILVHGCYWHRHGVCRYATTPSTRAEFWKSKFEATVERDKRNAYALKELGLRVIVIWECELKKNPDKVLSEIQMRLKEE